MGVTAIFQGVGEGKVGAAVETGKAVERFVV
jgi:hypothetical protein